MNRFAIKNGLLQSDLDLAGFKRINDATPGGDGGGSGFSIWKDVTAAPYNADKTGVADCSAAINGAILDVFNLGGGTVFFPLGTYLCNGAFDSTTNSILKIPMNGYSSAPRTILLLGEVPAIWGVHVADALTTRIVTTSPGSGTWPSLLAGNDASIVSSGLSVSQFNMTHVCVRNLTFKVPDNPLMSAIRFDAVAWAQIDDCVVTSAAATQPTHPNNAGVFMPNTPNFGINRINNLTAIGFDTAIATGEHLKIMQSYFAVCNTGISFNVGGYPCVGTIICDRVVNCMKFNGPTMPVDMVLADERSATFANDIYDPSNFGSGIVKYVVTLGGSALTTPAVVTGGVNIQLINLHMNVIDTPIPIGPKARFVQIVGPPGGTKLQVQNSSAAWEDVDSWVAST
jgi:hypothetical protein